MNTGRTPRPVRPGERMRALVAIVAFAIYSPPPASGEISGYFFHVIGDVSAPGEVGIPAINASGEVFLSHTKLDDGVALRVAIGNLGTVESDVDRCRELLKEGSACLSTH